MSKRASFTPGPWVVKNGTNVFTPLGHTNASGITADDSDGWHIADCAPSASFVGGELVSLDHTEEEANARLIAAAPDLLEALRNLELGANTVDGCYTRNPGNFAVAPRDLREYAEAAREAIAKATGADHERN